MNDIDRDQLLAKLPRIEDHIASRGVRLIGSGNERTTNTCPATEHKKNHLCVSVNIPDQVFHCHDCQIGGSIIDWMAIEQRTNPTALYKELAERYKSHPVNGRPRPRPTLSSEPSDEPRPSKMVATYDYEDERGRVVYQVCRYEPKTFKQRRPDGNGGWIWGMDGVTRVPFRLPQVSRARSVCVCYSPDTEVLTKEGWLPIRQASGQIAQWRDGVVEFVDPSKRVCFEFSGELVHIKSQRIDMLVTPEHRVLCRYGKNTPVVIAADAVTGGRAFPVSGVLHSDNESPTVQQARVLAAWQADGTIINRHRKKIGDPDAWHHLAWNIKKDRKKERLRKILSDAGLDWTEQSYPSCPEWTLFCVRRESAGWILKWIPDKRFHIGMMSWSLDSRQQLIFELQHWDGDSCGDTIRYFTSDQQSAKAIEAIGPISGFSCISRTQTRITRPHCQAEHIVNLRPETWNTAASKPERVCYTGPVYCVTVPSGFVLVRRLGKCCISGNCEGEKDVLNLERLGFTASCNVGGAEKWLDAYSESFKGKDIIIMPDNDEPGRRHGEMVLKSVTEIASSIRVVPMPKPHKDVSDYIASFPDEDEAKAALGALIESTPHTLAPMPIYSIEEMERRYIASISSPDAKRISLTAFLPSLGAAVRALVPGDLAVIIAQTAVGKTALLQSIARSVGPAPTLFFELELPDALVFERFVQIETAWSPDLIERIYKDRIAKGQPRISDEYNGLKHILVCPESGLSIEQIEGYINRSSLKFGTMPTLVCVDYIGLIRSDVAAGRYEAVSYAAEQLKVVAKRTGTIIFMASQVSRPDKKQARAISLHDGKDSGSIEASAGLVIGAEKISEDAIRLTVLKNTKGRSGTSIECNFDGNRMQITERSKIDEADIPKQKSKPPEDDERPRYNDD